MSAEKPKECQGDEQVWRQISMPWGKPAGASLGLMQNAEEERLRSAVSCLSTELFCSSIDFVDCKILQC